MPSWLKPARCLSMGQRQRIESAIRASRNGEDGIVFDDFCAYVDDQNLGLILGLAVLFRGGWCPEFVSFVVASLLLLVFLVVLNLLFLFLFFVVFCLLIFLLLLFVLLFFSYCYCCLCSFSFLLVLVLVLVLVVVVVVVVVAGEHDFESDSMMLVFFLSFSILFLLLLAHCYLVLLLPSFVERRHSLSPFCGKLKSNVNDVSWCVCCIFRIVRSSFSCAASIWRLVKNNNGDSSQKQFFDRNRSTCERLAG